MTGPRYDVLDSLRELGPSTARALSEHTGREPRRVCGILRDAEYAGYVRRVGEVGPYDSTLWDLMPGVDPQAPGPSRQEQRRAHLAELRRRAKLREAERAYHHLVAGEPSQAAKSYRSVADAVDAARDWARANGQPWPPEEVPR